MIILNSKETKTYIYHSEIGNKKDYISLSFSFNLSDLNIIIIIIKMDECESRYTKSAQIATRTTSVNICVIKR